VLLVPEPNFLAIEDGFEDEYVCVTVRILEDDGEHENEEDFSTLEFIINEGG
jgi:hypothetical protein